MTTGINGRNRDCFTILLTNARSLGPKIVSLQNCFEAHDIDFALITESWLKNGDTLNRDVIDLEYGTGLKILYRNRPQRCASARRVGGGVSIVFRKSSCSFKERRIAGHNFELLAAIGKVGRVQRQVAIFCVYIEPKMKAAELRRLHELLSEQILQLKANNKDPLILVGGDLNRRDISPAFESYIDITRKNHDPTRGNACLDVLYSNISLDETSVFPPLQTREGVKSDHSCVIFNASEKRERNFVWQKKTTRVHTSEAVDKFRTEISNLNWEELLPDGLDPDEMIRIYETVLSSIVDRLFPFKTVRLRSNEAPWITNRIRRLFRRKCRVYKRDGKSRLWQQLQDRHAELLARSRKEFAERMKKGGVRQFFSAVKSLGTASTPKQWDVCDLFPGLN